MRKREKREGRGNTVRRASSSPAGESSRAGAQRLPFLFWRAVSPGLSLWAGMLSVSGIRMAIRGFRERERSYLTCKIGLPANAAALILFFVIFIGGLR